jgi:hypothetical protein
VIDGDDYQIVQVEAPEVLPSEMRAAIRWRLRDAVSFSVDEAAVDIFQIPDPVRRTQTKMLFAVAARESAIQRVTSTVKPAAKGFDAIDIPDALIAADDGSSPEERTARLTASIRELENSLEVRSQALQILKSGTAGQTNGFAARLEALARRHVEGVWIDALLLSGTSAAMAINVESLRVFGQYPLDNDT